MHRTLRRSLAAAAVGVGLGSAPALAQDAISIDNAGDITKHRLNALCKDRVPTSFTRVAPFPKP